MLFTDWYILLRTTVFCFLWRYKGQWSVIAVECRGMTIKSSWEHIHILCSNQVFLISYGLIYCTGALFMCVVSFYFEKFFGHISTLGTSHCQAWHPKNGAMSGQVLFMYTITWWQWKVFLHVRKNANVPFFILVTIWLFPVKLCQKKGVKKMSLSIFTRTKIFTKNPIVLKSSFTFILLFCDYFWNNFFDLLCQKNDIFLYSLKCKKGFS